MDTKAKIEVVQGDITDMEVDAIVNAANTDLKLGSGVAGAIRAKGGPSIQHECNGHGAVSVGEVAITSAGDLPATYVIHAAAMQLGGVVSAESLKASTQNTLIKATENNVRTIAFPAIGTGVGGFPLKQCAVIMISTALEYLSSEATSLEKIYFVLFDKEAYENFKQVLDNRAKA